MILNTFKEAQKEFAIDKPEWLANCPSFMEVYAVGSRRTCDPAPMDTDDDYLIYSFNDLELDKTYASLAPLGWVEDRVGRYRMGQGKGQFISYRKEDKNLIVSSEYSFVEKFLLASSVAKAHNILSKTARIACFDMVFSEWEANLERHMQDIYV